ncbi:MAG TPA: sigma-70 family RNA polymerase sigma factor [Planctomycetota bacterium]
MTLPPGDLLARFQAGEVQAFTDLVGEMGPRLRGFFLRQGSDGATADDLTQNVFLRVLQGADRYQESGRLDAYLLRIARNLWIDHRRRRRPWGLGDDAPEPVDEGAGPLELASLDDRAALVRRALGELDEAARELLELAVLQRLPYREVGAILGVPVGTVKSRVYYALRRLRAILEARGSAIEEGLR